jgi:hypothetical protein
MAASRPTMRQLKTAITAERRAEMQVAIAEGRLTVRQMTPEEHREAHVRRAAHAKRRSARSARR